MIEHISTLFCLKKLVSKPVHHELRPSESPLSNRAECWVKVVEVCGDKRCSNFVQTCESATAKTQFCGDAKVTAAEDQSRKSSFCSSPFFSRLEIDRSFVVHTH